MVCLLKHRLQVSIHTKNAQKHVFGYFEDDTECLLWFFIYSHEKNIDPSIWKQAIFPIFFSHAKKVLSTYN